MSRLLVIRFDPGQDDEHRLIHRVRNFGGDVFRHLRNLNWDWGHMAFEQTDSVVDVLTIDRLSKGKLRRLEAWTRSEVARQNLTGRIEIVSP